MHDSPKKSVVSDKDDEHTTIMPILKEIGGRLRFGSCLMRVEFHNGRIAKFETFDERKKFVVD